MLSPVLPCAGRHFQFICVGPTPAGRHPGAHLCQTFVQQGMEVLGTDERRHISSRQRHGGPGLAGSVVPTRAGAGSGDTAGASVGGGRGWEGKGQGCWVRGEPCHPEVCIACEWLPISSCRELLLKSPDHYKFCSPTAAFEWFLYAPEGDLPPKKSPKSARVSSQYQQIKCFCHSFQSEENLHLLTDGGVLLNLPGLGQSELEMKGVMV